jgi:hypothetical protein
MDRFIKTVAIGWSIAVVGFTFLVYPAMGPHDPPLPPTLAGKLDELALAAAVAASPPWLLFIALRVGRWLRREMFSR